MAYNLCDEKCPEHCSQPWRIYSYVLFDKWYNISKSDMFPLPKPQVPSKNWAIDESFKIIPGKMDFNYSFYQIGIKTNNFKIDLNIQPSYILSNLKGRDER